MLTDATGNSPEAHITITSEALSVYVCKTWVNTHPEVI